MATDGDARREGAGTRTGWPRQYADADARDTSSERDDPAIAADCRERGVSRRRSAMPGPGPTARAARRRACRRYASVPRRTAASIATPPTTTSIRRARLRDSARLPKRGRAAGRGAESRGRSRPPPRPDDGLPAGPPFTAGRARPPHDTRRGVRDHHADGIRRSRGAARGDARRQAPAQGMTDARHSARRVLWLLAAPAALLLRVGVALRAPARDLRQLRAAPDRSRPRALRARRRSGVLVLPDPGDRAARRRRRPAARAVVDPAAAPASTSSCCRTPRRRCTCGRRERR